MTAGENKKPLLVCIDMGYGHLRAAHALSDILTVPVMHADRAPLADSREQKKWAQIRATYELISRTGQFPIVGRPIRYLLDSITDIPHLHPVRDLTAPTLGCRLHNQLLDKGIGMGLIDTLRMTQQPLLTTYFTPALAADRAGYNQVYCVVTDSDINRVWAPVHSQLTRIQYLVPSQRALRRMRAYGVPKRNIHFTGFPLPHELVGGKGLSMLRKNLAARLVRLDPKQTFRKQGGDEIEQFLGKLPTREEGKPPHLVFAVGGAGAQSELTRLFLPSCVSSLKSGRLKISLVAGVRKNIANQFKEKLFALGLKSLLGLQSKFL